ncbi:copper transport protein ATOX1 [Solenopsis invicta]|uniref:copper transport protein ATOX1 n=1 Tax=Solenopsis invicta TaxID=13686 RepID=UPI0001FE923E|nr:copper transport protein ATOX1 [Solenopsis invicta]
MHIFLPTSSLDLEITYNVELWRRIVTMAAQVHEFSVEMTCEGCSTAVQNVLRKKEGINDIKIDLPGKKVLVTTALDSDEILQTIKKTGKGCQFLGTR